MDPLNPLDAEFVEAENEDRHVSMAIASIAVFEGPAPSYEEFVETIGARLPLVPRYRQKLRTTPLRFGPPVWVDDPHFDIRYHIRETALPAPGGDSELALLMARLMAQRLDRDRPLWEDWMVTGLAEGGWALISKVHHSMVDGVSGTDLYRVMFDTAPPGSGPSGPLPGREPSDLALLVRAARDNLVMPLRRSQALFDHLTHPPATYRQAAGTLKALQKLVGAVPPAPPSSLSGPIGQQRRYVWVRVPLDDIKTIKRELGGTVNDAVLAVITNGFRTLLLHRQEKPVAHQLPSLVPVSVRAPGEENIYENRVSAMIVELPVHIADPVAQLRAVRVQMEDLKASGEAAAGQAFVSMARYVPYPLASLVRFGFRIPQREIVTVTTNVPGPQQPLYCLGRRIIEIIPYVPIASTVRIGVAIFSYCGQMTFGITGDYDSCPDLDVLARGIEDGAGRLLAVARGSEAMSESDMAVQID
jgi:WS/DGAT/MGAT family acyltransferase